MFIQRVKKKLWDLALRYLEIDEFKGSGETNKQSRFLYRLQNASKNVIIVYL